MQDLLVCFLSSDIKDEIKKCDLNIVFQGCYGLKNKISYVLTFLKGFKKPKYLFLAYLIECFSKDMIFLIKYKNDIIGCFTLRKDTSENLFLYDFVILSKYRGAGLGKGSLLKILDLCKNMCYTYLSLYVDKDNLVAKHLYSLYHFVDFEKVKEVLSGHI